MTIEEVCKIKNIDIQTGIEMLCIKNFQTNPKDNIQLTALEHRIRSFELVNIIEGR